MFKGILVNMATQRKTASELPFLALIHSFGEPYYFVYVLFSKKLAKDKGSNEKNEI
jgi:hypothetical protein